MKRNFSQGSGSAKLTSKTFEFNVNHVSISEQMTVQKAGHTHGVASAEFVDASGAKIEVSVWNDAYRMLKPLQYGL